jgi:hypothetical protein
VYKPSCLHLQTKYLGKIIFIFQYLKVHFHYFSGGGKKEIFPELRPNQARKTGYTTSSTGAGQSYSGVQTSYPAASQYQQPQGSRAQTSYASPSNLRSLLSLQPPAPPPVSAKSSPVSAAGARKLTSLMDVQIELPQSFLAQSAAAVAAVAAVASPAVTKPVKRNGKDAFEWCYLVLSTPKLPTVKMLT